MDFWLKKDAKKFFRLPVNPESFSVSVDHRNTVVNIVSIGDINLLGKTGLRTITLSSFFPGQDYPFAKSSPLRLRWIEPEEYVRQIEKWRKKNILVRLIVDDLVNIQCSIESFEWGVQDGTEDIYYTLSLKEYRTVSAKKRTQKKIKATYHMLRRGDTLGKLAKQYYGKNTKKLRNKIYKANKKRLKSKTKLYTKKDVGPVGYTGFTKAIKIPAVTLTSWK